MRYELLDKPDYGMIRVTFEQAGEAIVVESGAMVARDTTVAMKTSMRGGLLAAAKRAALGGESFFMNTFTASRGGETLWLAPASEGDVEHRKLSSGEALFVQSGAFVAASSDVKVDTKWGGAKGFFSGAGLFLLRCAGPGDLFFSTYGAVLPIDVTDGLIVDTDHIVAFEPTLEYRIKKVGGMKALFLSGEGLVCEFSGKGRLWVQTRSPSSLAGFLEPFRRVKKSD